MWLIYGFAFFPILIGAILRVWNKKINWIEWLIGSGAALVIAIIFNIVAVVCIHSKTADVETWSGNVTQVEYHPAWVERWIETHVESYACGTDSKGNTTYCTRVYFTTEYDSHEEHWEAQRYFGLESDTVWINVNLYHEIKRLLGNRIVNNQTQPYDHGGTRSSGDDKIYATPNDTGFIYPATIKKHFENRIKATPNLFQFAKLTPELLKNLPEWPENPLWDRSNRLIGTAVAQIDTFAFDQMNARLGPFKRINILIAGFENQEQIYGQYLQSKFIGGKKNDLVITYSMGDDRKANWCYVFGWSESELVKRNIETIFLNNPIDNSILPLIEQEIAKNYVKKEWKKFDYIKVSPPTWVFTTYFIIMILTQVGLYIFFNQTNCFPCEEDFKQPETSYYDSQRYHPRIITNRRTKNRRNYY